MTWFSKLLLISSALLIANNSIYGMEPLKIFNNNDGSAISAIAVIGNSIVTGSQNGTLRFLNLSRGLFPNIIRIPDNGGIFNIKHVNGNLRVTTYDGHVYTWRLGNGAYISQEFEPFCYTSICAKVGNKIIGTDDENIALVYDMAAGTTIVLDGHTDHINAVAVDNGKAITGSTDCTVRVWDSNDGRSLQKLEGHTEKVYFVDLAGPIGYSASFDTTIRIWDINTGNCLGSLQYPKETLVRSVAFDGTHIVAGFEDGRFAIWS